MAKVKDLKEKLIAYLDRVDFSKMSTVEISEYVSILKSLDEMEKPSPFESLAKSGNTFNGFGGKAMPVKGDDNG